MRRAASILGGVIAAALCVLSWRALLDVAPHEEELAAVLGGLGLGLGGALSARLTGVGPGEPAAGAAVALAAVVAATVEVRRPGALAAARLIIAVAAAAAAGYALTWVGASTQVTDPPRRARIRRVI